MKKLSTLLLALIATTALWAESFIVDGITYNKLGGYRVAVTSNSPKYSGSITIHAIVTYKGTIYHVTSIGDGAFEGCYSLDSITIPNSVTSIGEGAFAYCRSLRSITIPNSVTSIGEWAFYDCTSLSSITIGNSVIRIGDGAFYECTSLQSVTIPNSVTSIGKSAFSECTSLSSITCYATTPPGCGYSCFNYVDKSIPVYVPEGSIDAYKAADKWEDFTNIQAIKDTPTDIKNVNENENENENHKVMKDGHLLILKNNHTYTLSGTPIK